MHCCKRCLEDNFEAIALTFGPHLESILLPWGYLFDTFREKVQSEAPKVPKGVKKASVKWDQVVRDVD